MSDTPNIRLGWRLRVRMAENRIPTATELKRRLDAIGYDITSAQLSRIVDERPAQVKTALLEALLKVLGGTLDDHMPAEGRVEQPSSAPQGGEEVAPSPAPAATPTRKRKPARPASEAVDPDDAGGPRVRPFSVPPKK